MGKPEVETYFAGEENWRNTESSSEWDEFKQSAEAACMMEYLSQL